MEANPFQSPDIAGNAENKRWYRFSFWSVLLTITMVLMAIGLLIPAFTPGRGSTGCGQHRIQQRVERQHAEQEARLSKILDPRAKDAPDAR